MKEPTPKAIETAPDLTDPAACAEAYDALKKALDSGKYVEGSEAERKAKVELEELHERSRAHSVTASTVDLVDLRYVGPKDGPLRIGAVGGRKGRRFDPRATYAYPELEARALLERYPNMFEEVI